MDSVTDKRENICAILMLKNENRYILNEDGSKPQYTMLEQVIRRLKSIVEEVYIVDNGSTDGSREVYDKYKDVLIKYIVYNDPDLPFDDVRDRKILFEKAKERGMKWMLVVDGDEVYEDKATEWIHQFCQQDPHAHLNAKFHYVNIWRGRKKYRVDAWHNSWFARLYSIHNLVLFGDPLHSYHFRYALGNGMSLGQQVEAPVKCLHYGWADWDHRVKKTERYMRRDMELTGISYSQAQEKYSQDTNERGIRLRDADPNWASEFRNGVIDY